MKLSSNSKRQKNRRILAIVLAALMLLSVFGTLIYNIALSGLIG